MSMTLYVHLESPVDGLNATNDRVLLTKIFCDEELTKHIFSGAKCPPLTEFFSADPKHVACLIDDPAMREAVLAKAPPIQWFDAAKVLPACRVLQIYFEGH